MKSIRETLGHILVMQLLVTAMIVESWANQE
jgi:hypothetical protein